MPIRFYISIKYVTSVFLLLTILILTVPLDATSESISDTSQPIREGTASIKNRQSTNIMFVENVGQFAEQVRFQSQGSTRTIWLAENAIWITLLEPEVKRPDEFELAKPSAFSKVGAESLRGVNIKLSFIGASRAPKIEPFDRLKTQISYFKGSDPDKWQTDVPVWGGVRYQNLYPGVDLELNAENEQLAFRLVCKTSCGQILQNIQLSVEGADKLTLAGNHLSLSTKIGQFNFPLLQVMASKDDDLEQLTTPVIIGNQIVAPFLSTHEFYQPLTLPRTFQNNPDSLLYSTFLGGSSIDSSESLSVDGTGNAFISGNTISSDFPVTPGTFDTVHNGQWNIFVARLSANGAELAYATYLGGSSSDYNEALSIDEDGNVFITGYTTSSDFPVTVSAFDTTHNGGSDAFVAKLNANGTQLAYSTYLGGGAEDYGKALSVDSLGNAFITGRVDSGNFPVTVGAFDTTHNGNSDVFIAKLNDNGTGLTYSTYLGGSSWDYGGEALAVDETGNVFITGDTTSNDFPVTVGAFDTTHNGGSDVFVAKLNDNGTELTYSTYLGGSSSDSALSLDIDEIGNAFIAGGSSSSDFPVTIGAFDTIYNGEGDTYVAKLSVNGTELEYSTYLGGSSSDYSEALSIDEAGNAFIAGITYSNNFPVTIDAFGTVYNGGNSDAFVAKINTSGAELIYATYLGGSSSDRAIALDIDEASNAFIAGDTASSNFPVNVSTFDATYNGEGDAFITKLALGSPQRFIFTPLYPTTNAANSHILEGGVSRRYYILRDIEGILVRNATITLSPSGFGTSDSNGIVTLEMDADTLVAGATLPVQQVVTIAEVTVDGNSYKLDPQPEFVVEIKPRPFIHRWSGGTVRKAKGGISAGLVAFLEGQTKGGLGWELEETDATIDEDDILRLQEQFQSEIGGGRGLGAEWGLKGIISNIEAGTTFTSNLKGLGLAEWQTYYPEPYIDPAKKAQAAFVLSGLNDIIPSLDGRPFLTAILERLLPASDYAHYSDYVANGMGVQWELVSATNASATIELGVGDAQTTLLDFNVLDAEAMLTLFGTKTDYQDANEWGYSLEQELGFDVELLTVSALIKEKIGYYIGNHTTKLKQELFYDKTTSEPVRLELSFTGEGNPINFTDITLQDVTYTFIAEGDDLSIALNQIHNFTALMAAQEAISNNGLIVGGQVALREVDAYLSSVPLSRYEVVVTTEGNVTLVPEIGFTALVKVELGAGVEFKRGREIVIERGVAAPTGLFATEVYPDRQYGNQAGKSVWDLLDNAAQGAWLAVGDFFNSTIETIEFGTNWVVEIVGKTYDGVVRGGAQLVSKSDSTFYALSPSSKHSMIISTEPVTITAHSWVPIDTETQQTLTSRSTSSHVSGDNFAIGAIYDFQPHSLTISPSATLVITYTNAAVNGIDETKLDLFRWDLEENNWQPVSATPDIANNTFTADVNRLGTFTLGYDDILPEITITNPIDGQTIYSSTPILSVLVVDQETGIDSSKVEMRLDGQIVDADYLSGTGHLLYFSETPLADGEHNLTIFAQDAVGNQRSASSTFMVVTSKKLFLPVVLR